MRIVVAPEAVPSISNTSKCHYNRALFNLFQLIPSASVDPQTVCVVNHMLSSPKLSTCALWESESESYLRNSRNIPMLQENTWSTVCIFDDKWQMHSMCSCTACAELPQRFNTHSITHPAAFISGSLYTRFSFLCIPDLIKLYFAHFPHSFPFFFFLSMSLSPALHDNSLFTHSAYLFLWSASMRWIFARCANQVQWILPEMEKKKSEIPSSGLANKVGIIATMSSILSALSADVLAMKVSLMNSSLHCYWLMLFIKASNTSWVELL